MDLQRMDLPGPTRRKVICAACGQVVRDSKEVQGREGSLRIPCAGGSYFTKVRREAAEDRRKGCRGRRRP